VRPETGVHKVQTPGNRTKEYNVTFTTWRMFEIK
jgi:hypothetical protein